MRLSECRGLTCLNYAEREHLRRSQLGVAMRDASIALAYLSTKLTKNHEIAWSFFNEHESHESHEPLARRSQFYKREGLREG